MTEIVISVYNSVHFILFLVQMHFDEGLSARSRLGDSTKLVTKGIRGKTASEKLTEEGLVKFSARVAIQVQCFMRWQGFYTCFVKGRLNPFTLYNEDNDYIQCSGTVVTMQILRKAYELYKFASL